MQKRSEAGFRQVRTKSVEVRVPEDLYQWLHLESMLRGARVRQVLLQAAREFQEREQAKPPLERERALDAIRASKPVDDDL
jgi:hypothetical protein